MEKFSILIITIIFIDQFLTQNSAQTNTGYYNFRNQIIFGETKQKKKKMMYNKIKLSGPHILFQTSILKWHQNGQRINYEERETKAEEIEKQAEEPDKSVNVEEPKTGPNSTTISIQIDDDPLYEHFNQY